MRYNDAALSNDHHTENKLLIILTGYAGRMFDLNWRRYSPNQPDYAVPLEIKQARYFYLNRVKMLYS